MPLYLTEKPEHSMFPEDPEQARVLAPRSVSNVHFHIDEWAEDSGKTLTPAQTAAIVADCEAWLEKFDQEMADRISAAAERAANLAS